MAYSMGFLPRQHTCSWNWFNIPLSCRPWKVMFMVKISAFTDVPSERYMSHKFCWKIEKLEKIKNFWKISKFVVLTFSALCGPKLIPITYSCSPKCGAFSHIWIVIFHCSNKSYFCVILEPMIEMRVLKLIPQKLKMAIFHYLVA
jgi:hypothetical protein